MSEIDRGKVRGRFHVECFREDGSKRWENDFDNGVTNVGFNLMLDSTFRSASITPLSTWYVGLISNSGYTGISSTDTMSSHAGWTEDTTHYTPTTSGVRPTWTVGAAATSQSTNSSSVNFAINTDSTVINGIFIVSDSSIGGTAGLFSTAQTLFNGDTLKITYTVTLS